MPSSFEPLALAVATFGILALASQRIGRAFTRVHLPLITGFLCAGILTGPDMLGLIPAEAVERLRWLDEAALAFIAFAAGAEVHLQEFRSHFRSIRWITLGQVVATFALVSGTLLTVGDRVPFMSDMPPASRLAVALLAGSVLIARSPSSAIAVVNELRARGPFTRTVLGVTVASDVVVVVLFAVASSLAAALIAGHPFRLGLVALVTAEILASVAVGYLVGRVLGLLAGNRMPVGPKSALLVAIGFGVFELSDLVRAWTQDHGPVEFLLEPLLMCMIGGFAVANFTPYRTEMQRMLDGTGPVVYVVFFTLTGASLALDVLAASWAIALLLFTVRLASLAAGSFLGGTVAGDPMRLNRIGWLTYVTQAGIGLGLAQEVAVEFPAWGRMFATVIIAVIVLNQLVGPPLFKWAIGLAGEAHVRAGKRDLKGTPKAVILGFEGQALALARQLDAHGWKVVVASRGAAAAETEAPEPRITVTRVGDLGLENLRTIGADSAQAIVCLMSDQNNLRVAEIAYEHFGTPHVIVRSDARDLWDRYRELGVTIVDPGVAMVSLLDHFVRSPTMASMLVGFDQDQDVVDLTVTNPSLDGLALRDLRLPLDTLILSVRREGAALISHGYTRLALGDRVTIVGSTASLDEVALTFSA